MHSTVLEKTISALCTWVTWSPMSRQAPLYTDVMQGVPSLSSIQYLCSNSHSVCMGLLELSKVRTWER